jgi:hypothetical protein
MNAWLFVDENIAPAIKSIKGLQSGWKKAGIEGVTFTGAVLDGKYIEPAVGTNGTCSPHQVCHFCKAHVLSHKYFRIKPKMSPP